MKRNEATRKNNEAIVMQCLYALDVVFDCFCVFAMRLLASTLAPVTIQTLHCMRQTSVFSFLLIVHYFNGLAMVTRQGNEGNEATVFCGPCICGFGGVT